MDIQLESQASPATGSRELKKQINRYWSDGAEGYHKSVWITLQPGTLKRKWQDIIREGIGDEKAKILDVGTGPGIIALLLADMGHSVTGIDLSVDMLKKARENAGKLNMSVEFRQGDAECIPFGDRSFDVVINRHVLWTLPDPDKALSEWKRVLRPGGKLVIIDGNWYTNLNRSFKNKIWRSSALPLISILERRNAFRRNVKPGWREVLPMTFKKRPEYDLELLNGLGFTDIKVRTVGKLSLGLVEYLKYGYYGDTFLISARKEEQRS